VKTLILALGAALAAPPAFAADPIHPVVVELFQSQGCSSCPPANRNVLAIAGRPDVLALSWQVTYWDYLGWKDSFGDHAFTARQYDYAHGLGHNGVFTPQVVVNGRVDGVGTQPDELADLLQRGDRGDTGPSVTITGNTVAIGAATGHGDVILVRYDPNLVQVPILRGENGGLTLPHRNVVREVRPLGTWSGQPVQFALPAATRPGLKAAILVQASPGGPIVAAAR
jgi:hypothetical protein